MKRFATLAEAAADWPECDVYWDRDCADVVLQKNYVVMTHTLRGTAREDGVRPTLSVYPYGDRGGCMEWWEDEKEWHAWLMSKPRNR